MVIYENTVYKEMRVMQGNESNKEFRLRDLQSMSCSLQFYIYLMIYVNISFSREILIIWLELQR